MTLAARAFDDSGLVLQKEYVLRSYRIGTLFGFPIRVNLSFLLLLGVVLLWMGGLQGLWVVLLAFASVLVHELGHALTARHLGVSIAGIELHFFGGAAMMKDLPRTPGDEVVIAAAGPAVSFALAGLGHGLFALTGLPVFWLIGWINVFLGAFNLIPAFPSDGGRILRAVLARKQGLVRATDVAVKVGRVAAAGLGLYGLFSGQFQLILLAGVLWLMGGSERLVARLRGDHGAWRPDIYPAEPVVVPEVEYIPPTGRGASDPARAWWTGYRQQAEPDASPPRPPRSPVPGVGPRRVVMVWRL